MSDEAPSRCSIHPDVDAIDKCSICDKPVCYVCAVETSNGCYCESCVDGSGGLPMPDYPSGPIERPKAVSQKEEAPGKPRAFSKEMRRDSTAPPGYSQYMGVRRALFDIWFSTLFTPSRFFRSVQGKGGRIGALMYGAIWLLVGLAAGMFWKIFLPIYQKSLLLFQGETIEVLVRLSPAQVRIAIAILCSPLIAMLALVAVSAVYNLSVVAFVKKRAGFTATLKVVCYCAGPLAFYAIPSVGGLIAGIWHMAIVTIGFKEAHRMSLRLAAAAAFLPCALTLAAGTAYTSWAVSGSHFDVANLLKSLFASIAG